MDASDKDVNQLRGDEGGRWQVWTQHSSYLVDLNAMTVTRIPGPDSMPTVNDVTRPIRTLDTCRVGERGFWTMFTDGWSATVDYFWQSSSVIRRIERMPDDETTDGE